VLAIEATASVFVDNERERLVVPAVTAISKQRIASDLKMVQAHSTYMLASILVLASSFIKKGTYVVVSCGRSLIQRNAE
jgi:hypothetical protein